MISPYASEIPESNDLITSYNSLGGDINADMDDLYPFESNDLNIELMNRLSLLISRNNEVYEAMLADNSLVVYDFIKSHYEIVSNINN